MSQRCKGCAFTEGTEANQEPNNHLKSLLCVLTPSPFYCHESVDYKNPDVHGRKTRQQMSELKPKICSGWREEVRQLEQTGYYKEKPKITKAVGENALETLDDWLSETDPEDKEELGKIFELHLDNLSGKWKRFRRD